MIKCRLCIHLGKCIATKPETEEGYIIIPPYCCYCDDFRPPIFGFIIIIKNKIEYLYNRLYVRLFSKGNRGNDEF
jgi:hypothetical protein